MNDDQLSQRERRRQQFEKSKPKVQLNKSDLKPWIGPFALLLLVGGVVGAMVITGGGGEEDEVNGCSSHYHYTLDIFLDGEKVILNPPNDQTFVAVGHDLHMHESKGADTQRNLIHNHLDGGANSGLHPENCFSYGDAFGLLSMDLNAEAMTLRAAHGDNAGTYEATDGKSIRVFGKGWEDTQWTELDAGTLSSMIPPVSSQLAIIYGDADADVSTLLDVQTTPYPTGSYAPPTDVHYTSFDDLREK